MENKKIHRTKTGKQNQQSRITSQINRFLMDGIIPF